MNIQHAAAADSPIIHDLMIKAFMAYNNEVPPSSALEETIQSVSTALIRGEQCLIGFIDEQPVGMVRFQVKENNLYFYRLSVLPEKQGQGIAKKILTALEDYAISKNIHTLTCKVRMTIPKNIQLYRSIGYHMCEEEVIHRPGGISIKVMPMEKRLHTL